MGSACVLRGGRPRAQSGEKQLRGALCRTPEWRNAETRNAAADALDAAGATGAAAAVRRRDCSALRKGDMLRLCRLWRYASHVWQPASWPAAERKPRAAGEAQPRARRLPRTAKATLAAAHAQAIAAPPQAASHVALGGGAYFMQPTQVRGCLLFILWVLLVILIVF